MVSAIAEKLKEIHSIMGANTETNNADMFDRILTCLVKILLY